MDQIIQARDELARNAYMKPPSGYKIRLIIQISLSCFCMYLVIWLHDARTRGKSMRMFRLQKTQGGRVITVQALYAYVWGTLLTGVLLLAGRVLLFQSYFMNGSNYNARTLDFFAWIPATLGVLAYTFANTNAALLLARKAKVALWSSMGSTWVWAHNLSFIAAIAAWLSATLPLGLQAKSAVQNVNSLTAETLSLLERIIDNPALLNGPNIIKLQSLQAALISGAHRIDTCVIHSLIVAVLYCTFFAVAGGFNLLFVYKLRKQLQASKQDFNGSDPVVLPGLRNLPDVVYQGQTLTEPSRVAREDAPYDSQRRALDKLVSDLVLSVPLVLFMCFYYPIAGGLALKWGSQPVWGWREFSNDIYSWPIIIINIIILGFFIFNSWRGSSRHGSGSTSFDKVNARSTFAAGQFPPTVWDFPQSGSNGKVTPPGEPPSPHTVHVTVTQVTKEDM